MSKPVKILKDLVSIVLRRILGEKITGKKFSGSELILYYERSQHLMFFGCKKISYEKNIQSKLAGLINRGDLIFDIGANIGQYSLFFSEMTGEDGRVISIEPGKKSFKMLQFNKERNRCSNMTCLNVGVGASDGDQVLYLDTLTGGRKNSFFTWSMGKNYEGKSETVSVMGFNSLTERFGTPDLVKIDVQGAESDVINGIKSFPDKTIFMVEVTDISKRGILDRFTKENYRCYCAEAGDFELIEDVEETPGGDNNLLFIPAGSPEV